jgi:hypothetical protein
MIIMIMIGPELDDHWAGPGHAVELGLGYSPESTSSCHGPHGGHGVATGAAAVAPAVTVDPGLGP